MGNNLCATWQRGYKEGLRLPPAKDTHLIRLWAEIFEVRKDNIEFVWERISEDVVPVNVFCVRNSPEIVLQVLAYNRLVEKIFDVFITQPGTQIIHSSECFVHWCDTKSGHEWGLNFTSSCDAQAFRDCCLGRFPQPGVPGRSVASDNTIYQKKGQVAAASVKEISISDYAVPCNPNSTITALQQTDHSLPAESDKEKQIVTIPTSAHCRRQKQHSEESHSRCWSQNAQPVQTNQFVSVYLDNRCHCAERCLSADCPCDHFRSRSLQHSTNTTGGAGEHFCHLEHCRDVNHGTVNVALLEQRLFPRHSCPSRCCHVACKDCDSSVNPTMYVSTTESKKPLPGHHGMAIEQKGRASISNRWSCEQASKNTSVLCHCKGTLQQGLQIHAGNSEKGLGLVGEQENSKIRLTGNSHKAWLKQKSSSSASCPQPLPSESPLPMCAENTVNMAMTAMSIPSESPNKVSEGYGEFKLERITLESKGLCQLLMQGSCNKTADMTSDCHRAESLTPKQGAHLVSLGISATGSCPMDSVTSNAGHSKSCESPSNVSVAGRGRQTESLQQTLQLAENDKRGSEAVNDDLSLYSWNSDGGENSDLMQEMASHVLRNHEGPPNDLINTSSKKDSISWPEAVEVRRLMTSDISGSDGGSDADDGYDCSSLHTMPSQASFASKSTVVRRAGWLTVKNWLVHRKRKIELASKRTWKKYWVCLKGNVLLFFVTDEGVSVVDDDASPRHRLVIEGGLAQPTPEHPKKENAFSLSTSFGDAYLFQASSQVDLDNWIRAIHSACAASVARQLGKENTLRLLRNKVHRLDTSIDLDIKMRKMALMHLASVSDPKSRQAIEKQLWQWEQNLEKLYIDHFRLNCYIASLQGAELPNPKSVLGSVSKNTKVFLSRIGVFTVSAFHAYVYARSLSPCFVLPIISSHLSTMKTETLNPVIGTRTQSSRVFSLHLNQRSQRLASSAKGDDQLNTLPFAQEQLTRSILRVKMSTNQAEVTVQATPNMTVQDVIESVCNRTRLNTKDHFLRLNLPCSAGFRVPDKNTQLFSEDFESVELCPKLIHQAELARTGSSFGFEIEAELAEDAEEEDELCLFISNVTTGGIAAAKGIFLGDEILVINGKVVSELDMVYVENLLLESRTICLTLRSCHIDRLETVVDKKMSEPSGIEHLMCPPPPSQTPITHQNIGNLIVPAPNFDNCKEIPDLLRMRIKTNENEQIDSLLKDVTQIMRLCHRQYSLRSADLPSGVTPSQPMNNSQRICKVVLELVDTERLYVRDLTCLIERYLEPLKDETYISSEDIEQLFGNVQEIFQFQQLFLHSLEDAMHSDPNFNNYSDNAHLMDESLSRVLLQIGNSFLYYTHHFKLYSSFCASHSKAQKMMLNDDNAALQEFLRARNPKQQHSSALESFLIKPIQRILKYPLLLKQLHDLTDSHTDEHLLLKDALRAMESVAEHINEMQKIYEEYGGDFEELARIEKQERQPYRNINLNVSGLQMYGTVNWINITDELGKPRKGCDILTLIFIFKSAVVILAQERLKTKKRVKLMALPSELTRFKTAIPISELQVRSITGDISDNRGGWEIIHCRSEKEGRPKKTYQFISSLKARNDFICTIHQTMDEKFRSSQRNSATSRPGPAVPSHRHHYSNFVQSHETQCRHGNIRKDQIAPKKNRHHSPAKTHAETLSESNHGNSITMTTPTGCHKKMTLPTSLGSSSTTMSIFDNSNSVSLPAMISRSSIDNSCLYPSHQTDIKTSENRTENTAYGNDFVLRQRNNILDLCQDLNKFSSKNVQKS